MILDGFIIIARTLLDSEVFADEKMLKIWVWLLLKANFKEKFSKVKIGQGFSVVKVDRGQLLFGRFAAEEALNMNGSAIYKRIKKLEEMGNISIESNSHYSVITICKYDMYQDASQYETTATEQPPNSDITAIEQPPDSKGTHYKNDKNLKNEEKRKKVYGEFFDFDLSKLSETSKQKFTEYCDSILTPEYDNLMFMEKPLTQKQLYKIIKEHGFETTKNIINEVNNWKELHQKNVSANLTIRNWLNRNK